MRLPLLVPLLLAAALAGPPPALAQGEGGPAVEPEAMAALQKMASFLQTLKSFSVKGLASYDEMLPGGLVAQDDSQATIDVQRPDHVRAEQVSDRRHRLLVYDGKTFSVHSKSSGYYTQAPVVATIYQLADKLEKDYAVNLPLLDLFVWADPQAAKPAIAMARVAGLATIRGIACDQYVFRQQGRDWQVWIRRGAQPLPLRVVFTDTRKEARPQYRADYEWSLEPKFAASTFSFSPPSSAIEVPLARMMDIAAPRK
jgi:hypothetical protein